MRAALSIEHEIVLDSPPADGAGTPAARYVTDLHVRVAQEAIKRRKMPSQVTDAFDFAVDIVLGLS
jgi:hypothetical protein